MKEIEETIGKIHTLFNKSVADGEFSYEHNNELEKLCSMLSEIREFDVWIPALFKLIEEFDETVDLTLGSPGPLVHSIENHLPHYTKFLVESLERKPTNTNYWMADRLSRTPGQDKDFWLSKIEAVLNHPNISATLKRDLEM